MAVGFQQAFLSTILPSIFLTTNAESNKVSIGLNGVEKEYRSDGSMDGVSANKPVTGAMIGWVFSNDNMKVNNKISGSIYYLPNETGTAYTVNELLLSSNRPSGGAGEGLVFRAPFYQSQTVNNLQQIKIYPYNASATPVERRGVEITLGVS